MHRSEYQEEISSWSEEACGVWDSTKDGECNNEGATSWISAGGLGNMEFESALADLGNIGEEARVKGDYKAHLGDGDSKEARLGIWVRD